MLANGQIPGQARGKNINRLVYDNNLENEAAKVSRKCKMNHIIGSDKRWRYVGQNLYIQWSSKYNSYQNWTAAANYWYHEYSNYKYNFGSINGKKVGHYTQLIWAKSTHLGCHFVAYFDRARKMCARLYTCNYGPGQYSNQPPYELA